MISGIATVVKAMHPSMLVIAAEPEGKLETEKRQRSAGILPGGRPQGTLLIRFAVSMKA